MMVPYLAGVQKQTAKPNGVDILGNHPGVPPPRSVCLISACCPLSGTILLAWQVSLPALAYLDLTAFWIPHFVLALEHGLELFLLQNLPLPQRLFDLWLSASPFPHNQVRYLGAGTRETVTNIRKCFLELDEIAF